jgi:hypothetical protein
VPFSIGMAILWFPVTQANDALAQEAARHATAVTNMHRLRALRSRENSKPKYPNGCREKLQSMLFRVRH